MKKHASGPWYKFIIPRCITIPPTRIWRWLNFYHRFKDWPLSKSDKWWDKKYKDLKKL